MASPTLREEGGGLWWVWMCDHCSRENAVGAASDRDERETPEGRYSCHNCREITAVRGSWVGQ